MQLRLLKFRKGTAGVPVLSWCTTPIPALYLLHHAVSRVTCHVLRITCHVYNKISLLTRRTSIGQAQRTTLHPPPADSALSILKMLSLTFATPLSFSLTPSPRPSSSSLARRRPQTAILSSPVKIYSDAVAAYALQEKPAWCQPATILATGATICVVSDALFVPRGALGAIAVVANGGVFLWCKFIAFKGRDWGRG